jgi:folylpolyglutamate synthase
MDDLQDLQVIHVAGTKGKGATCYFCSHLLRTYQITKGKPGKIGCLTSPHLEEVRERIQINSEPVSKTLFVRYFREVWDRVQSLASRRDLEISVPGYPGFLALLGIYTLLREKVDVAIVETGIGGERDSTNIFLRPVATGITTIGLDHVKTLGSTIEEIAWHKAGIFKFRSPAFTVVQDNAALRVLQERARKKRICGKLQIVGEEVTRDYGITIHPDMSYQRSNVALAIMLADTYLKSIDPGFLMTRDLACSLEQVKLPGRCEIRADQDNTWLLSVAHNELSLKETVAWLKGVVQLPK